jgi:putative transferase (TIGR04331 family)
MISQKKLIRYYSEFSKKIKLSNKNIDREFKLDFNIKNDFEKLLSEKIVQFFPLSHLEGFKKIQSEALKINLRPKYIVTTFGHISNDLFKIWTAENIEKAYSKLIISSHGGYIENCINFNSWINISDKFISWENTKNKKIVQLPPLILANTKKNNNNKNILFCTSNTNLYAYRIHDYVVSSQIIEVMNFWKKFFLTINKKAKNNIIIRHIPNFDPWNQKSYLAKLFRHNALSKKKKFIDELRCAKIVINTAMQTTFFESMNYGTPTLVLLKYDLWNLSHKGKCIYDKLKKNKILFNNISDLNQHLDKILDAPDIWWNTLEIKKIREEFHSHYCKKGDFTDWNNFFNNLTIK